jgi:serine-protein kinase ATM
MTSQIVRFEHEGNWSKSLEYYDLLVRSASSRNIGSSHERMCKGRNSYIFSSGINRPDLYKGLVRSLQKTGCTHMLDMYCQGLTSQKEYFQNDPEFLDTQVKLKLEPVCIHSNCPTAQHNGASLSLSGQFEAAWRAGNWDFSFVMADADTSYVPQNSKYNLFNENLHK